MGRVGDPPRREILPSHAPRKKQLQIEEANWQRIALAMANALASTS